MQPLGAGPGAGMLDPAMQQPQDPMAAGLGGPGTNPGALPTDPAEDPSLQVPGQAQTPPPEPVDPVAQAIDSVLLLEPKEAIRRVYQLAVSAARAKAKVDAAGDAMDVRTYHAMTSQSPEVRYVKELGAARRRLDTLAAERRRLTVEVGRAQGAGKGNGILDAQLAAADMAMDQVARGVLLFLSLPSPQDLNQEAATQ